MLYIDQGRCTNCGNCVASCSVNAIKSVNEHYEIDNELCTKCLACLETCPSDAIIAMEVVVPETIVPVKAPPQQLVTIQSDASLDHPRNEISLLRDVAKPALTAALFWTGRQLIPHLASLAYDRILDRPITGNRPTAMRANPTRGSRPEGNRQRKRQRRGSRGKGYGKS